MLFEGIFGEDKANASDFYYRMFRFMKDNTSDIFWCVDLSTNVLYFMGQSVDKFNIGTTSNNFPYCLMEKNVVSSTDEESILSMWAGIGSRDSKHF